MTSYTLATIEELPMPHARAKTYAAFALTAARAREHWRKLGAEASVALKAAHAEGSQQGVIDATADVRRHAATVAAETRKLRGCVSAARENIAEARADDDEGRYSEYLANVETTLAEATAAQ